jgi:hypothetical protein
MTTPMAHAELAAGRWMTLSILEQLANIGSEVERATRSREAGRHQRADAAFDRALELFDLSAADPRWRGPRLHELLRAREMFCGVFFDSDRFDDGPCLRKYFLQFAMAARLRV